MKKYKKKHLWSSSPLPKDVIETQYTIDGKVVKYRLVENNYKFVNGTRVFQIQALTSKPKYGIKKYQFGGYIESILNLSFDDGCWVFPDACIYGLAQVKGNARISGCSKVYGNARIDGDVCLHDSTEVFGSAVIKNDVKVYGNSKISGNAVLTQGLFMSIVVPEVES